MKSFKKGEVIFRQGDPGDCMYEIVYGRVGVYADYDRPGEKLLAELCEGDVFGEMSLIEKAARSATVVALDRGTQLIEITDDSFLSYFEEKPVKVFQIMQQLSQRLRQTTQDYLEVCRTVYETVEAKEKGSELSEQVKKRAAEIHDRYAAQSGGKAL
ncbi:MAG: cyclic nucleotide-binding domain-containing protein [Oscillospiraceae bacterium]|nr:cyclic nucleotide-binding domain-containing protein [Oscillospiraceae bacterium]